MVSLAAEAAATSLRYKLTLDINKIISNSKALFKLFKFT